MNTKTASKRVLKATLGPTADYAQWQQVGDEARLFYATNACQSAERQGIGKADPVKIVAAMHDFYSNPENQNLKVSMAFGMMFSMHRH